MTYDCLALSLRTPGRFDCTAFVIAIQKVLWDKIGCDRKETGVMSYTCTPDGGPDEHPFTFQRIQMYIRVESGKVPMQQFRVALERYLAETLKLDPTVAYVGDLKASPDVLRSEL